jgi:hypothetical protein
MGRFYYRPCRRRRRRPTNWVKWIVLAVIGLALLSEAFKKEEALKGTQVPAKAGPQGLPAPGGNMDGMPKPAVPVGQPGQKPFGPTF